MSTDEENYTFETECNIRDVQFKGFERTNRTIVKNIVADIFQTKTLGDFVDKKTFIVERFEELNAFKDIDVALVHRNGRDFDVRIAVEEKGRIGATLKAEVDPTTSRQSNISIKHYSPNISGLGDTSELNFKFNERFCTVESCYRIPLIPWRKYWAPKYASYISFNNWDRHPSGFEQKSKAFSSLLEFRTSNHLNHVIRFENVLRTIRSSSIATHEDVRKHAGHSFKSSLQYDIFWDSRDLRLFHHEGSLLKISNEVTNNFIDKTANFSKHQLYLQINKVIAKRLDLISQFNLSFGILHPVRVGICDKFFVGGPMSVRGFKLYGLGCDSQIPQLGGDLFLTGGLHVFAPLPYNKDLSVLLRPQAFINIGTIGQWRSLPFSARSVDFQRCATSFRESLRYSVGAGLVLKLGSLKLELNYCFPLISQQQDKLASGIQFGCGLDI